MSRDATVAPARGGSTASYAGALAMLLLAGAFPVGLMVFNPTLMFERGWHQYAGTAIYGWALLMLLREWGRLRRDGAWHCGRGRCWRRTVGLAR